MVCALCLACVTARPAPSQAVSHAPKKAASSKGDLPAQKLPADQAPAGKAGDMKRVVPPTGAHNITVSCPCPAGCRCAYTYYDATAAKKTTTTKLASGRWFWFNQHPKHFYIVNSKKYDPELVKQVNLKC